MIEEGREHGVCPMAKVKYIRSPCENTESTSANLKAKNSRRKLPNCLEQSLQTLLKIAFLPYQEALYPAHIPNPLKVILVLELSTDVPFSTKIEVVDIGIVIITGNKIEPTGITVVTIQFITDKLIEQNYKI
jgi:hypothetical protein